MSMDLLNLQFLEKDKVSFMYSNIIIRFNDTQCMQNQGTYTNICE